MSFVGTDLLAWSCTTSVTFCGVDGLSQGEVFFVYFKMFWTLYNMLLSLKLLVVVLSIFLRHI